jgi:copper homeostasis protein
MVLALGFRSILTSGGSLKAPDGVETIAAMVRRAGDRLEILAGSGLNPDNVRGLVEKTGVRAVHGSFSAPWPAIDPQLVRFGYIAPDARETSEEAVRRVKTALSQL